MHLQVVLFPYYMVLQMYMSDEEIQLRGHCTSVTSDPIIGRARLI